MPQDEFYGFSGPAVPNVWPAPGKINIGNNEYGDVPGAVSALFSGDTLIVGAGVMAVLQQKINTNCNIQGSGIGVSRWLLSSSYAAAVQFGSIVGYVQDMTIEAQSGVVSPIAIEVSGTSAVMEFRRVFGRCINTINDIGSTAWATRGTVLLSQCEGSGKKANGTTLTALQVAAGTTTVVGGYYEGRLTVDSGATCVLFGPVITGSVNINGAATGHYYDSTGNLITINTSGESSGVWLVDESATRKLKQSTLAAAITAAASSGDSIKLDSDTYAISAQQTIDKSLTIEGDGPEATIITVNLADNAAFRPNADNITVVFRNLTIDHNAGAGTLGGALFNNNAGVKVILDNAVVKKSGGAPTTGYGAWLLAGTLELRNGSKLLCTSGASQYGVLNDSSGDVTIIIGPGCEVGGATADVYSNRAGSTIALSGAVLTNNLISWSGTVQGDWHNSNGVLYTPESNDLFSAQTFRPNYIIQTSVSSNNLTVALKTMDGNDASASSPIVVRVGDAARVITAGLSVTKNAGTNWCAAGSATMATNEVDYFVYLIQESGGAAGTKIGFSRIPYARIMGDFVNTSTDEKYIAGNWTNFNSSDPVEVIGRFNATLSAASSYNWSILGTSIIINRPIYDTRWLNYAPQISAQSGSITTVGTVAGRYQVALNKVNFYNSIAITTNGTGAGGLVATLPFTPPGQQIIFTGRDVLTSGVMLQGVINAATVVWYTYLGAYPAAAGSLSYGGGMFRLI